MVKLTVRHINPEGSCCGTYRSAPCIDIRYSFSSPTLGEDGVWRLNDLSDAVALIDTGADLNLIDETLVPDWAAPKWQTMNHSVNSSSLADTHNVTLHIAQASFMLTTDFLTMPAAPRQYGIILGRKFLQNVRFRYDGAAGISDFTFIDDAGAA